MGDIRCVLECSRERYYVQGVTNPGIDEKDVNQRLRALNS